MNSNLCTPNGACTSVMLQKCMTNKQMLYKKEDHDELS